MNSINVIFPYKLGGQWMFDDASRGLLREALVMGTDDIIEKVSVGMPDGFSILFSSQPFPKHQFKFDWVEAEVGGNWYHCEQLNMSGWLCPSLLKYFDEAPKELYVQFKAK